MPSQSELRQQITSQIVAALEQNTIPWRRPWRTSPNAGRPTSVASLRPYQGINVLLLALHAYRFGFQSKFWGTYQQWEKWGCNVTRRPDGVEPGAWGAKVVLYKPFSKTVADEIGNEDEQDFLLMRTFTVFNAEQVEGKVADKFLVKETDGEVNALPDFEPFEELIAASKADIRHGGEKACYHRPTPAGSFPNHMDGDLIAMPEKHRFDSLGGYYETIAHELAHWCEVRLKWDGSYAMGELIAEMSAIYLCQELGVPSGDDLTNHASYLQSWIAAMKNDPKFIFQASTQASKVTDYLLGFVRKEQPQQEQVA